MNLLLFLLLYSHCIQSPQVGLLGTVQTKRQPCPEQLMINK